MTPDQFGEAVKAKYPDYRDVPNDQLSQMVVAKHPEYASQVDFNAKPSTADNIFTGLTTNDPQGFTQRTAQAVPSAIGGMLGGPAGAGVGEALRQGLVYAKSELSGDKPPSILEMGGNVGMAAAGQKVAKVAAPYVAKAISAIGSKAGYIGRRMLRYSAENLAGVKPASYEVAEGSAKAVSNYLNAGPEVGDRLAGNVRSVIANAIKSGEENYPKLIAQAQANPEYAGKSINLQGALGDKVLEIADKYGFQSTPGLKAPAEASKFWRFASQIDGLKEASLDQVYNFQKQLNTMARSNAGKPLGSAFGQLKSAVAELLGNEIPEIGKANASYAAAKAIEDQTGKLTGSNDLLQHVLRIYKSPQETLAKQTLSEAAQNVPGLPEALNEIRAYGAAHDFSPLVRSLPQTGMGASIARGFVAEPVAAGLIAKGATGSNLLAAGTAAATAARNLTTSPRLALAALKASQAVAPAAAAGVGYAAEGGRALVPLAAQAMARMSPASIAAFYRSPGAQ